MNADHTLRRWEVPDAEAMYRVGAALAAHLRAGDLVLMTGELGAGKTTLAVGIGRALRVRGAVTSPTFVIAREHPPTAEGPALVHVDAYRLGGLDELEDLDLSSSLDESITLVEWGHGLAEGLSTQRLEVLLDRNSTDEVRTVRLAFSGSRWSAAEIAGLSRGLDAALRDGAEG